MRITGDGLLGGRVRYMQPSDGFRTGIEPVLLAASVPARPGARVLEGGAGAGAALLCLAARVPGLIGIGIEQETRLARLAQANANANNANGLLFAAGDIAALPFAKSFDHVFANPPYHADSGTPPPETARRSATHAARGTVETWAAALGGLLRQNGTLTLILPPARLTEALAGSARAGCGSIHLFPLWPGNGRAAKLLLFRAVRDGRTPLKMLPGMTLHTPDGHFTEAAEACLRDGGRIDI